MRRNKTLPITAVLVVFALTGCGQSTSKTISVQSVSMLCGMTSVMQSQQFAGIVNTGKEQSISKDSTRKVAKVNVEKGDYVEIGDVLFVYDAEAAKNSLEKAELELEEQKNSLVAKQEEKKQLEEDKKKAAQKDQLDYVLKINEIETDIRESNYNITLKEKEIKRLEDSTKDLEVVAPFAGMIAKTGKADTGQSDYDNDDYDYSNDYSSGDDSGAFIKIVETDNYRIKGTINEQNVNDIYTGMEMKICSRLDPEQTWVGTITEIDLKSTESNQNNSFGFYDYGGSDEMTSSSKYAFYVSIDDLDGLIVGQHVYMVANDDGYYEEEMRLDASFVNDADTDPWIWAESEEGTLEKRKIRIDSYDASDNTWVITSGIEPEDYVAPASGDAEEGLTCIENNNSAFGTNDGGMDAEYTGEFEGDEYVGEDFDEYEGEDFYEEFDGGILEPQLLEDDLYDDADIIYDEDAGIGFQAGFVGGAVG